MGSLSYLCDLLYSQLFIGLPYPTADFSDQVIIVTGANSGLGLEAARHLVRLNAAKVILAVRDSIKGAAAASAIKTTTQASQDRVEAWGLDLTSFVSIRAFAYRVSNLERLDVVIQNAGIVTAEFRTREGNESTFATNVIRPALLAFMVLPKLRASAEKTGCRGRMTFNGSNQQKLARFAEQHNTGCLVEALNCRDTADMRYRYATTKRLSYYLVLALAAKVPYDPSADSNVIINYCTCGVARSNIVREPLRWREALVMKILLGTLARTTEHGSRALIDAVRLDLGSVMHGAYLRDCRIDNVAYSKIGSSGSELQ